MAVSLLGSGPEKVVVVFFPPFAFCPGGTSDVAPLARGL